MRSDARLELCPGSASAARTCPEGGAAATEPWEAADAPASTATARKSAPLPKGLTGLAVEEVHARDVHGDGNPLQELQRHVRRELRDEVRPRRDDSALARRHLPQLLMLAQVNSEGVDIELDDR